MVLYYFYQPHYQSDQQLGRDGVNVQGDDNKRRGFPSFFCLLTLKKRKSISMYMLHMSVRCETFHQRDFPVTRVIFLTWFLSSEAKKSRKGRIFPLSCRDPLLWRSFSPESWKICGTYGETLFIIIKRVWPPCLNSTQSPTCRNFTFL